jgi:hypothetical protein
MGRQFQIYLLPSDAAKLVDILKQGVELRLLSARSITSAWSEIDSPILTEGRVTRADCLISPMRASIRMKHIEGQNLWSVDTLVSEVIEFKACYFDGTSIKRGRMYYHAGFYDGNGAWRNKSPEFLSWAGRIFKIAKHFLKRDKALDAYIGKDAYQWRSSGGVFIELAIQGKQPILAE